MRKFILLFIAILFCTSIAKAQASLPAAVNRQFYDDTISAAVGGIVFFALIFNLFFYRIVRERQYMWRAILSFVQMIAAFDKPLYYLFLKDVPGAWNYFYFIDGQLSFYVFLVTMLAIIHAGAHFGKAARLMYLVTHGYILLSLLNFIFRQVLLVKGAAASRGYAYSSGVSLFLMLVLGLLLLNLLIFLAAGFKKRRESRLVLVGIAPFLIFYTSRVVFKAPQVDSWLKYGIIAGIVWAILVITWMGFERFKQIMDDSARQALANERLAREQEEERNQFIASQNEYLEQQVTTRTAELVQSLEDLKSAQSRLIQSEKMASLGELTAGIAHEIQNPLNFVNNFSDINLEMLAELEEALNSGDIQEGKAIAGDLKQNEDKINFHGKRADHIVKGMLEHSRTGNGTRELTDLNKLAGEYLQLAYHGLRAKDKDFNATLVTRFDEKLPQKLVIPQEIGRVLLNLFNNAFYTVRERAKKGEAGYRPTVELKTGLQDGQAQLVISDNGEGIPPNLLDKIMQPFFTTKPTGQGTGLGLSISYDILVKGHGGHLEVNSTVGQGTVFIILLP